MFSDKMNEAVRAAQNTVDICCSADNISVAASAHISEFAAALCRIDPADTDFDSRSLFAKGKIARYWERFEAEYPHIEELTEKLLRDRKILSNTVKTLTHERDIYEEVLAEFRKTVPEGEADKELLSQLAVAENMSLILDNTLREYTALTETAERVLNVSRQALDIAVILAKTKYKVSLAAKTPAAPLVSETEYKSRMKDSIAAVKKR